MSSWASEAALETSRLPKYQASDEDLEHHLCRLGLQYKLLTTKVKRISCT